MADHYRTLEIDRRATADEIKKAYRKLAKQFHPDRRTDEASHDRIVEINAAYEILGDPKRKKLYDADLRENSPGRRQERAATAQENYRRYKESRPDDEAEIKLWYGVYNAVDRLIGQIIRPLNKQIEYLSADPFDDELMAGFQEYLETSRRNLEKARQKFSSHRNPAKMAKVAANIYHCLNHIGDGLDELEYFTYNYDDRSLHTGKEMYRMAARLKSEAKEIAGRYKR